MPICKVCGRYIKSLGFARHRTMHVERAAKAVELANQHTTRDTSKPQAEISPIDKEILEKVGRQKEFFHNGLVKMGLI